MIVTWKPVRAVFLCGDAEGLFIVCMPESVEETQIVDIVLPPTNEGFKHLFRIPLMYGAPYVVEVLQRIHDQPVKPFDHNIHKALLLLFYT
jgi:hypothetical protein